MNKFIVLLIPLFFSVVSFADVKITILHTSDIHGHFTNRDSPIHLGGVARLKSEIDYLRQQDQNSLLLDSGDWSEGTIFYVLNSGEADHRMMEAMGYDAIVLGNHEWLVGPRTLYEAFQAAQFSVPVLGANLNMPTDNKDFHLDKYIKPYVIKNVAGKKIGIFGLTTFQMIFDPFFEPVEVKEPIKVALQTVKKLREVEKCDVVILLSHLGIGADKQIAESVPGIDIIVGGHTHVLTKDPVVVNGIPIVHIGTWAQYLGEYELTISDQNKVTLTKHIVHQIDETEPENPLIKGMVDGFQTQIQNLRGKIFDDNIFSSQVNLPVGTTLTETVLQDWAVDAIRKAGKTKVAFDIGQYYRRNLFPGHASTVDFFDLFPHIYNKKTNKNWTVLTMDVSGQTLMQMINVMAKMGTGVHVSGATYRIDGESTFNSVKDFNIDYQPIDTSNTYHISATQGIFQALDFVKRLGGNIGVYNVHDTGIEAWKVIKDELVRRSPITPSKAKWMGRVRTVQPDIFIPLEQVLVKKVDAQTVAVTYSVINAGLKKVATPSTQVKINLIKDTVDGNWLVDDLSAPLDQKTLGAGKSMTLTVTFKQTSWRPGYYNIVVSAPTDPAELIRDNNSVNGYFLIQ